MDRAFDSTVGTAAEEAADASSDTASIQRVGAGSGGPATGTVQLDRAGGGRPDDRPAVTLRRYLIVANQTLDDPILRETIRHRCEQGPVELHVLVPQPRRLVPFCDPMMGVPVDIGIDTAFLEIQEAEEAADRLGAFLRRFAPLAPGLSGQVVSGDPVAHARRLLDGGDFHEIIVSTPPPGIWRWLRLDLSTRLGRAFAVPVVAVAQLL